MLQKIRIVIADDHPLYRDGVARTLSEAEGIAIVGQVGSAAEAEAAVAEFRPDLALLDISMPGGGVRAARRILAAHPDICVAMLTVSEDGDDLKAALEAGANGYVLKGIGGTDLARIIRELAGGGSYVSPSLAARILKSRPARGGGGPVASGIEGLTKREEDVLRLVARGLSNREIGGKTGLQEKTVKHYMTSILQKLPARNRVEAALMAREVWGRRVHDSNPGPELRHGT
ncbi:MAG: response regulator [Alphaproteobacteria bacterium]